MINPFEFEIGDIFPVFVNQAELFDSLSSKATFEDPSSRKKIRGVLPLPFHGLEEEFGKYLASPLAANHASVTLRERLAPIAQDSHALAAAAIMHIIRDPKKSQQTFFKEVSWMLIGQLGRVGGWSRSLAAISSKANRESHMIWLHETNYTGPMGNFVFALLLGILRRETLPEGIESIDPVHVLISHYFFTLYQVWLS